MSTRYGLYGVRSRDFLTMGGRVLVHDNKGEMEFLFAGDVQVRELPRHIPPELTVSIRHHPSMAAVTWPLNRKDFL